MELLFAVVVARDRFPSSYGGCFVFGVTVGVLCAACWVLGVSSLIALACF